MTIEKIKERLIKLIEERKLEEALQEYFKVKPEIPDKEGEQK